MCTDWAVALPGYFGVTKTVKGSISVVVNRQLAKTLSEETTPIQSFVPISIQKILRIKRLA
jgi:hypothetical protein